MQGEPIQIIFRAENLNVLDLEIRLELRPQPAAR